MKARLFLLFSIVIFTATSTAQMFTQPLGVGSSFRDDAQVELQNVTGGHALLSISNVKWPCGNEEEAAITFNGYDEGMGKRQVASVSAMWANNCTLGTGYGVLRLNVANPDRSHEVEMRIFGKHQGIDVFGSRPPAGDNEVPGGRFMRVNRTRGMPSIAGNSDTGMVVNGDVDGEGPVFLNAYGKGVTVLSAGGGPVQVGTPVSNVCPNGWKECLRMLDSNGATMYMQVGR